MSDLAEPTAQPSPPRRRLRFSLASLLWAVVVVSLLVTTVVMGVRLRRAEREAQKLRDEFGHLTIQDPKKINAIANRSHDPWVSCWYIYLPPGHNYKIWGVANGIPATGLARKELGLGLPGGETWIVYAGIRFQEDSSATTYIEYHAESGPGGGMASGGLLSSGWMRGKELSSEGLPAGQAVVLEPDRPAVVLRVRAATATDLPSTPCDGFLVWIEPEQEVIAASTPGSTPVISP